MPCPMPQQWKMVQVDSFGKERISQCFIFFMPKAFPAWKPSSPYLCFSVEAGWGADLYYIHSVLCSIRLIFFDEGWECPKIEPKEILGGVP